MVTLEVKVEGFNTTRKAATYEVIWVDWVQFKVMPTSAHGAMNRRRLVSDGRQAFQILRGKAKARYFAEHGYDPSAVYEDAAQPQR